MIKSLKIKNFKSIKSLETICNPLNLIVGTNSSGKSSLLQCILLYFQNILLKNCLNGPLIHLGTFQECKCKYTHRKTITIEVKYDNYQIKDLKDKFPQKIIISDTKKAIEFDNLTKMQYYSAFKSIIASFGKMIYPVYFLSCNRVGPKDLYPKRLVDINEIDQEGNFIISYLHYHRHTVLNDTLIKYQNDKTLLGQVNYWLNEILNTNVYLEEITNSEYIHVLYNKGNITLRPTHIGSGVSYLISIIVLCLSSINGSVLLIENPEIHLHPLAQSKLCKFFEFIAKSGRQLFIESHSDHMFNGIRADLANEDINKDDVMIGFTDLNKNGITEFTEILIGEYGNVLNQKDNLFEQFDIDLNRMLGLDARNNY